MCRPATFSVIFTLWLAMSCIAAAPATQPVSQPVAVDFYVLPFTSIGSDASLEWAGRAVQQNLLTDLARNQIPAMGASNSPSDARAAAQNAGARYLILGTYQLAEQLVRFNGQLIDTHTGSVVGGISATGAPRDLFNLEDSLSAQVLQQAALLPGATLNKPAGPVPAALQPQAVAQLIQPAAVAQVGTASSYQGSALQQYVDADRTPSTDYQQQVQDAQYRNIFGSYNNYGYGFGGLYSPYYFGGGYGFGLGYGGYRGGYGFGYGGFFGGYRQHIVNADR